MCPYCGSMYLEGAMKCRQCGAPRTKIREAAVTAEKWERMGKFMSGMFYKEAHKPMFLGVVKRED